MPPPTYPPKRLRRIRASWAGVVDDRLTGWSLLTWLRTMPGRVASTSGCNFRKFQNLGTYRS